MNQKTVLRPTHLACVLGLLLAPLSAAAQSFKTLAVAAAHLTVNEVAVSEVFTSLKHHIVDSALRAVIT